ncbi:oligopeptide/dipeptide ABC transporter ATP-binding protein [Streptomyces sp. NPDC029044]|uniref:oligopeptide/dipeptide ABC transporter ATP-binding protein n=1 Tax=Streptomyces sp. NPDC029044 TaxID=3157198 RepID=UPI0033F7636C
MAGVSRKEARTRAVAGLDRVGIPDAARRSRAFPHEYSGGMRQRAVIAMATVNEPDVVVADEPTTALDEERRDQVLRLPAEQREAVGAALVLVTHDMDVVGGHADRVPVMYAGRLTELGAADEAPARPRAPCTAGLPASLPRNALPERHLPALRGTPPVPGALPTGCAFAPRCPLAADACRTAEPEPREVDGRLLACHRAEELPHPAHALFLKEPRTA